MSILALIFVLGSCIGAVFIPWLGVVVYYMVAVGQLAALFPHHFGDSRFSLLVTLSLLIGLGLSTVTGQVNYWRLLNVPNALLAVLIVFVNVSVAYSGYIDFEYGGVKREAISAADMLSTFNKIMVIYYVSVLLIDTRFKLITLISCVAGVLAYYTFWANEAWVLKDYWRLGDNGRLNGPDGGIYYDENFLALVYVLVTPIFYYLSVGTSSRWIRYGLWIFIPASWHALFLTQSRGALLALAVVCGYIFLRSYSRKASVALILCLIIAVVDQSGNMLNRVSGTVTVEESELERAFIENDDDSPFTDEKVIDPRLNSWIVAGKMMKDFPVFGVGLGSFLKVYPAYSDAEPHVAHNTFLQFATNSGIVAGLIYLYFLYMRLRASFRKSTLAPGEEYPRGLPRDYLDDLLTSTFIGCYATGMFIDMMIIELMYFIFLIGTCKYILDLQPRAAARDFQGSIYRSARGKSTSPAKRPIEAS